MSSNLPGPAVETLLGTPAATPRQQAPAPEVVDGTPVTDPYALERAQDSVADNLGIVGLPLPKNENAMGRADEML